jgi:hypothetical protein
MVVRWPAQTPEDIAQVLFREFLSKLCQKRFDPEQTFCGDRYRIALSASRKTPTHDILSCRSNIQTIFLLSLVIPIVMGL